MDEVTKSPTAEDLAKAKGSAKMAQIIYFLYLATLIIQVAHFVGAIMAYMNRYENDEWLETHFQYQIRTFWIYTLFLIIGAVMTPAFGIGFLVILAAVIWLVVRCAKGMTYLSREQAVPNPTTWLW